MVKTTPRKAFDTPWKILFSMEKTFDTFVLHGQDSLVKKTPLGNQLLRRANQMHMQRKTATCQQRCQMHLRNVENKYHDETGLESWEKSQT